MRRRIAVALVVSGLVVACSTQVDRVTVGPTAATPETAATGTADSRPGAPATTTPPSTTLAPAPMAKAITDAPAVQVAGARTEQAYDAFVAQVILDLDSFWVTTYPAIAGGATYEPLERGVWPVWTEAEGVPGCGGERRTSYPEIEDNAFYCPDERLHRLRRRAPLPPPGGRLRSLHGGHGAGPRVGPRHPGPRSARPSRASSPSSRPTASPARGWTGSAMAARPGCSSPIRTCGSPSRGSSSFRDSPGTSADDEGAHGSAFDRVGSFQDGCERWRAGLRHLRGLPAGRARAAVHDLTDASTQGQHRRSTTLVPLRPGRPRPLLDALLADRARPSAALSGTSSPTPPAVRTRSAEG